MSDSTNPNFEQNKKFISDLCRHLFGKRRDDQEHDLSQEDWGHACLEHGRKTCSGTLFTGHNREIIIIL